MSAGILKHDRIRLTERAWYGDRFEQAKVIEVIELPDVQWTLDFDLSPSQVFVLGPDGEPVPVDGKFAQVRTSDEGECVPLSIMSESFGTPDYSDRFTQAFEAITGAHPEVKATTVGTLQNGRKAFMSFELPEDFSFDMGGIEQAHQSLNVADSCDGSSAFTATNTVHRVVCANTFAAYVIGAPRLFKVKHTRHSENAVGQALAALHSAMAEALMAKEAVDRLLNEAFSEDQFRDMISTPDMTNLANRAELVAAGKNVTQMDRVVGEIMTRYNGSDVAHCRDTKWGALQTIQGWEQHDRSVRGAHREDRHMESVLFKSQKMTETAAQYMGIGEMRDEFAARANEFLAMV